MWKCRVSAFKVTAPPRSGNTGESGGVSSRALVTLGGSRAEDMARAEADFSARLRGKEKWCGRKILLTAIENFGTDKSHQNVNI